MKKDLETRVAALVAKCWTDQEFKQRFLREPKVVIAEVLLALPPGAELVVLEDTKEKRHLVLPEPPPEGFAAEDLGAAARRMLGSNMALYCLGDPTVGAPYCEAPGEAAELAELYCVAPERVGELAALYCVGTEKASELAAPYCAPPEEGKGKAFQPDPSAAKPLKDE